MGILASIGVWQLILIVFALICLLFPVLALISIIKNEFKDNDKLIWVIVVLFLPFLGAILYFLLGRPKRIKK
jgi:uncharacterized membrane protein YhaH (DUF805 family)